MSYNWASADKVVDEVSHLGGLIGIGAEKLIGLCLLHHSRLPALCPTLKAAEFELMHVMLLLELGEALPLLVVVVLLLAEGGGARIDPRLAVDIQVFPSRKVIHLLRRRREMLEHHHLLIDNRVCDDISTGIEDLATGPLLERATIVRHGDCRVVGVRINLPQEAPRELGNGESAFLLGGERAGVLSVGEHFVLAERYRRLVDLRVEHGVDACVA